MQQRISIITLGVRDLEISRKFYIDGLQWKASASSNDNITFFQLPSLGFALYQREALAGDAQIAMNSANTHPFTLAYNAYDIAEVDGIFKHIISIGGTVIKTPQQVFWGGYSGYFQDPDGFVWEVAYNPYFSLQEDGGLVIP